MLEEMEDCYLCCPSAILEKLLLVFVFIFYIISLMAALGILDFVIDRLEPIIILLYRRFNARLRFYLIICLHL
jgi:hypothetical protein